MCVCVCVYNRGYCHLCCVVGFLVFCSFFGGRGGKRGEEGKAGERYDEDEVDLGRSLIVDDFISSLHTRAILSEIEDF